MSDQSKPGHNLTTTLLIVAGAILLLAGTISLLPSVSASTEVASEGTPANFGDEVLPLRPTVTPLPRSSQVTPEPIPEMLPDTSVSAGLPAVTTPAVKSPGLKPTPVDPTGQNPTRIVIPSIKLDAPVKPVGWHTVDGVSQWDVPDTFAAGWLMTSATLGKSGNTVLTGHHNIDGEVFRYLVKLQPGDHITLYAGDQSFVYEVASRRILPERGQPDEVRRANARWIQPTNDERVTLITCWPYTSNTHRLVIVAKPLVPEKPDKLFEP
jgi:LPXTG-site transpeptidase (sortase) family protein